MGIDENVPIIEYSMSTRNFKPSILWWVYLYLIHKISTIATIY